MKRPALKKWLCIVVCAVLLVVLCVFNIPIPINRTVDALEIDLDDESHVVSRTITLEGYYHINLFSEDSFSGLMRVSGYEFTDGSLSMDDLEVGDAKKIVYQSAPYGDIVYLGSMWSDFFLDDITIWVASDETGNVLLENTTTADGIVIVSGAGSYAEASQAFEDAFYD